MKKNIAYIIAVLFVLIFAGCSAKDSNVKNPETSNKVSDSKSSNLKLAEDFTLDDLSGNKVTLSSLIGKKVFLNFWATWCAPCVREMPEMEAIHNMNMEDLVIVAVNSGESKSKVQNFVDKNGFGFKILLDQSGSVSSKYKITGIPKSIFINSKGYIVDEHVGSMSKEQMEEYIKKLD
jgi:thiol-disulfide isomerase/thioredoxin